MPGERARPRLPDALVRRVHRAELDQLRSALRMAGLRMLNDGRWRVVVDDGYEAGSLIQIDSLQNKAGDYLPDAVASLTTGEGLVSLQTARQILEASSSRPQVTPPATPLQEIQEALLMELDPMRGLALISERYEGELRLFRIRATEMLYARDAFWRSATESVEAGTSWGDLLRRQELPPTDIAIGHIHPSRYVCGPLVARHQPLAAVFTTARFAAIAAVPNEGGFLRQGQWGVWPSGGAPSLARDATSVYRTRYRTVPSRLASGLLASLAKGADHLMSRLSSPAFWIREDREIDVLERNIAWSSLQFGLECLEEIGADWEPSRLVWTGFRALTILQGLWAVPDRWAPSLTDLLTPQFIRNHAIELMPPGPIRDIESDYVDNYEEELRRSSRNLSEAIRDLVQVRNLVHGAGVDRRASREKRLAALRSHSDTSLQLTADIARLWWTAVLLNPGQLAPPGPERWIQGR